MTLDDVASLVLASAAAARAYAPDVRAGVRRLLGAGVRVGAETLLAQHRPAVRTDPTHLDDVGGGR
ncbi:hypothetical protein ACH47Z_44740 [Streptomyces sp. NPDC020192]|uniref:hypothetical protein n=1 Tax=Streptomyces sp. NPDC020192 TaxID=3365066 RepID=UPI0037A67A0A